MTHGTFPAAQWRDPTEETVANSLVFGFLAAEAWEPNNWVC